MRICFDRLCFATKRPAENDRADEPSPPKSVQVNDKPYQLKVINKNLKNTNKNGSINALDPPIIKQPTTSQSVNLEIIEGRGRTFADDDKTFGAYENSLKISDSDIIFDIIKFSSTSSANNKLRKIDLETDSCGSEEMDQKKNSNIQYQQELLLNNISTASSASDILTNNLIFGTISPNGESQVIHKDPDIELSILEQQNLQLKQRYQNLQSVFHRAPIATPSSPSRQIATQMQELRLDIDHNNYNPSTPMEEHLMNVIKHRDLKVKELTRVLDTKEIEIAELKSHLDKFQSVFPFSRSHSGSRSAGPSRQRAQGISAEPHTETNLVDLLDVTFQVYEKNER